MKRLGIEWGRIFRNDGQFCFSSLFGSLNLKANKGGMQKKGLVYLKNEKAHKPTKIKHPVRG